MFHTLIYLDSKNILMGPSILFWLLDLHKAVLIGDGNENIWIIFSLPNISLCT